MQRILRTMALGLVSILGVALLFANTAQATPPIGFDITEAEPDRPRCDHFDPLRQPFFGTTHLHTGLSFDASIRFVETRPRDAYQFAKGKKALRLPDQFGLQTREVEIDLPIDFGAVTDHAEHFGEMGICKDYLATPTFPNPPGRFSMECRMLNGFFWQPRVLPLNRFMRTLASAAFQMLSMAGLGPLSHNTHLPVCIRYPEACAQAELDVWNEMQAVAEEEYDRSRHCTFTTFNAYEVTSTPAGSNWHRNVIFRNDRVVKRPITAIDMAIQPNPDPTAIPPKYLGGTAIDVPGVSEVFVTHPLPQRLWNRLEVECLLGHNITDGKGLRCDVLTIPHNSNLSNRIGALPPMWFDPFSTEDAIRWTQFQPLVEIYQNKGSSECRYDPRFQAGVDTIDEWCNFELLDTTSITSASDVVASDADGAIAPRWFSRRAFIRNVLKDGLKLAEEKYDGVNPFKVGVVAASDTHNGTMGWHPETQAWPGHLGIDDAEPARASSTIQNSSGGHTVVWAEENSRDAIFEAMRRKETYGTSGTRIIVRFFGGWDFDANLCGTDFVPTGYDTGVPMGGDLPPRPSPQVAPRFLLAAWMDDFIGTPLEQIQIIKGWVDRDGETHEQTIRVAGNPGDANNPQAGVTNACQPYGHGFDALCTVWEDPDFDPSERAFYYARVLERPVCRYSTDLCQSKYGLNPLYPEACKADLKLLEAVDAPAAFNAAKCCSTEMSAPIVQPAIQERAWTSPIWYTPGG
jgi:hypothetical protein